jgi:membrane-associated phospholipid phosphatase
MVKLLTMSFILYCSMLCFGQYKVMKDSVIITAKESKKYNDEMYHFSYKKLIIPTAFIGFGVISLNSDALKNLNSTTKYEISEHQPKQIKLDNYTQYLPAAMVYGYNLAGLKGKHNFKERTIIYGASQLIVASVTLPLKHLVKEERPDGSNNLSFPSGHTATAFSSAHFLFREYKDENIWLAISGYPIAAFTGIYRAFNDKHWIGDIIAGAGFGILSTEIAYWIFPIVNKIFKNNESKNVTFIYPVIHSKSVGLGLVLNL